MLYQDLAKSLSTTIHKYLENVKAQSEEGIPNAERFSQVRTLSVAMDLISAKSPKPNKLNAAWSYESDTKDEYLWINQKMLDKEAVLKGFIRIVADSAGKKRLGSLLLEMLNANDVGESLQQQAMQIEQAKLFYEHFAFQDNKLDDDHRIENNPFAAIKGFTSRIFEKKMVDLIADLQSRSYTTSYKKVPKPSSWWPFSLLGKMSAPATVVEKSREANEKCAASWHPL